MDPFLEDEEESYFEEEQREEIEGLLRGTQRDMRCPVCNVDTKKGERFNGLHSLLQHSQTKRTKNKPENLGHIQQAEYIKEFQKQKQKLHADKHCVEEGEIGSTRERDQRSSRNDSSSSSRDLKLKEITSSNGIRREREAVQYDEDIIMEDYVFVQEDQHVVKKTAGNCFFTKNQEMEVWPPVIIFQGIQAVKQKQESWWQPLEITKERLHDIVTKELQFTLEDIKTVKLVYGKHGIQIDNEIGTFKKGEKIYGLGIGCVLLNEKAYHKLVDFNQKMSINQRGRESWNNFCRYEWPRICRKGDFLPSQNNMLYAYHAVPADIEQHLKDYKKFIIQKDKFRGDHDRLHQQIQEITRQKLQSKADIANLESNFSTKLQQKTVECLDLKQVLEQKDEFYQQKDQLFQEREQEILKTQTQRDELQKQYEQQQQQNEELTKVFQQRIAAMQRESNSQQSTHDAQVGQLVSKLQIVQLGFSKEDLQRKRALEQCYEELQQKELEMQMMREQVKTIELEVKDKELQNLKVQQELQKFEQQGGAANVEEINDKLKTLGINMTLDQLQHAELNCQSCQEEFIPYQNEPLWHTLEETRFDIGERNRQKEEWKRSVRGRFCVKLDCKFGCTAVCMDCAETWWTKKGKEANKQNRKTRKCPYCRDDWKSPPKPLIVNLKLF